MESIAPAIASVIIVAIVFAYLVVRMALKHEEKKLALNAAPDERVEHILAETQAQVAKLSDRVQVLERLATDDDTRLAREIDRLGKNAAMPR